MDSQEIIKELKANASEKYRENVIRMGIPAENSIGKKLCKKSRKIAGTGI